MNKEEREYAVKLVQEVKKRPILYALDNRLHDDRCKIDEEWEALAAVMKTSALALRKRWQSLRGSFGKAVRAQTAKDNSEVKKHVKFYLYEDMKFLLPHMGHLQMHDSRSLVKMEPLDEYQVAVINDELLSRLKSECPVSCTPASARASTTTRTTSTVASTATPTTFTAASTTHAPTSPLTSVTVNSSIFSTTAKLTESPIVSQSIVPSATSAVFPDSYQTFQYMRKRPRKRFQGCDEVMFENRSLPETTCPELSFFKALLPMLKDLSKKRKICFFANLTNLLMEELEEDERENETLDLKISFG